MDAERIREAIDTAFRSGEFASFDVRVVDDSYVRGVRHEGPEFLARVATEAVMRVLAVTSEGTDA